MSKYIKTLVFIIISILICSVILSDPTRAQVDIDIFKEKISEIPQFTDARDIYDFSEYRIKWNDLDWIELVKESKNILRTRLADEVPEDINDTFTFIDIEKLFDAENTEAEIKFSMDVERIRTDFNLLNKIFYSDLDSDEDSEDTNSTIL